MKQNDLLNEVTEKSSLSQIQEYNEKVVVLRGFSNESIQETMLALLEETGELAKAIRQTATNMVVDADKIHNYDASVKDEAADVFAILMTICSKLNINLHNAFVEKEKKNCERIWSAER